MIVAHHLVLLYPSEVIEKERKFHYLLNVENHQVLILDLKEILENDQGRKLQLKEELDICPNIMNIIIELTFLHYHLNLETVLLSLFPAIRF